MTAAHVAIILAAVVLAWLALAVPVAIISGRAGALNDRCRCPEDNAGEPGEGEVTP